VIPVGGGFSDELPTWPVRNAAAHSPTDIRTVPLSTDAAAARCRSSDRAASSNCSATGNKAASDSSYHGGSRRGGFGKGLAADIVSVRGETRMERFAASPFYVHAAALVLVALALESLGGRGAAPFVYSRF